MNSIIILSLMIFPLIDGHGYIFDPIGRASRWRKGFAGPTEYTDNQLFCGGRDAQWNKHGGKCGVCGDEYGVTPKFEYPGAFAINPPIVKTYTEGQQIQVTVHMTANHKGYFTFRVAPLVNPPIKQEDLDKTVLKTLNGDSRWNLAYSDGTGDFKIFLKLPLGLSCSHCVLQWWYTTGNNHVNDKPESFVNCADIKILPSNGQPPPTLPPQTLPPQTLPPQTVPPPPVTAPPPTGTGSGCKAVLGSTATDTWCVNNCALGFCPSTHCVNCN